MESKMLAEIRFRWLHFESPPRLIKMHDQPPLYIYIQISVLFYLNIYKRRTCNHWELWQHRTTMPWWRENSNYCFLWHNEFWVVRIVPTFLFIQLLNMHSSFLLVPTYMIDNKHDRHVHIPWYSVELIQCSTVNISDAFNEDSDYLFLLINENVFFVCKRYAC